MSNLKILTFLAFTFITSVSFTGNENGVTFSEELLAVKRPFRSTCRARNTLIIGRLGEGKTFKAILFGEAMTRRPATWPYFPPTCGALIGGIEIISHALSTFALRPYCSTCGPTYNGLLFDNWYFLPGVNGTILGLNSTQFNNLTFTSWKLGDCDPLALGVHNASKILYISCATYNNTVSLRVVDYVRGREPGIVTFEMNSASKEYSESRSGNPGIFVEYNSSYHFVLSSGNDLLIHKLDGFLVKHLGTYRAPCSSCISDIALLKDNASLITKCGNGEIYVFHLHSANFTHNSSLSTQSDSESKVQSKMLVYYSDSYVAIWSSKEITSFATSSWVFATISDLIHNNSITSLTFVESEGSVLVVYTVADVGVYAYNVTGALIHGIKTVSIIPGSKSVQCVEITSDSVDSARTSEVLILFSCLTFSICPLLPLIVMIAYFRIRCVRQHKKGGKFNVEIVRTQSYLVSEFGPMRAGGDGKAGLKLPTQATGSRCYDLSSLPPKMKSFLTPPEVDYVLKTAGCFVLGEIQTITIPDTGGEWNLYPFPNDKGETCAMLSAPPGVVASGETVVVMYGVIPSGPFVFPDELELASVLIYLDCNDKEKLQKPLSLCLKHCIMGDDEVLQNSLCFVKASHTPQDSNFVFQSKSNAVFDNKSGTLEFTDFCFKGICVKKACEEIDKISTRCYAIPCKIQLHPTSRVLYEYRICLIFGLPSWENVFRVHYCTHSEYNREIHLPQEVEFTENQPIKSYVNETDMNGNGWKMMKLYDSVAFTDLESAFNLLKFREKKCEQIIAELELGLIFPHVRYVITFDKEPNTETHCSRAVCVTLQGCKPKDTHFYTLVKEELRRERTPEGAEDGEGLSCAPLNQQQSPIGGFVLPGTFGNGFLDWTPSDLGLLEVVEKSTSDWWKIAIFLLIPFGIVEAVTSEKDHVKVLKQWRDGMEGCKTPSTWNTLLAAVKDKLGDRVHDELKKEVMENELLSIRKETRH